MIAGIIFTFKVLPRLSAETLLDEIKTNGQLVVITRNSPVSYYEDVDGPAGLDYELAQMFADRLGVELALVVPETFHEVLDELAAGEAHIAAAGLTVTPEREKRFHFGPPYQEVSQQLVYNVAQRRPKNLSSLDGLLEVVADSSHAERLHYLQKVIPTLSWKENDELDSAELLQLVAEGIVDYTIVDSNEFTLNQRYLLNLRVAFDISEPEPLAWALKKSEDKSLLLEVQKFFREIRDNGELTRLIERNYGHVDEFDYVGTKIFRRHIAKRLPAYEEMFRQAAEKYNLDWRLLAAIGYQESHWDPKAVSPTGVRGIMMLTRKTAKSLGVNNRLDPASSIEGGARYYSQMLEKMDPDIPEPDRSWLAMAAYNVGYYHLQDARKITRMLNKDPNRWFDVKESLPLLAQKKWHRKTRYGYARGWEPVQYVENIRSYYDILKREDKTDEETVTVPPRFLKIPNSL